MTIKYKEHPESASFSWEYVGGCFANGEFARYVPATVDTVYKLDKIPIEVRQVPGDSVSVSPATDSEETASPASEATGDATPVTGSSNYSPLKIVAKISFLSSLIFLALLIFEMYK
jgi:hypothetical protein